MKKVVLKNCPNCKERIGIHDIECPYCKYIDDPKYKKYNANLKKKKVKKTGKNDIYKVLLLIPIMAYLIYLMLNIDSLFVVIFLILLNVLCLFLKKVFVSYLIILEIIVLILCLIINVYDIDLINSLSDLIKQFVIFGLGILFVVVPKYVYILKSKKRKEEI